MNCEKLDHMCLGPGIKQMGVEIFKNDRQLLDLFWDCTLENEPFSDEKNPNEGIAPCGGHDTKGIILIIGKNAETIPKNFSCGTKNLISANSHLIPKFIDIRIMPNHNLKIIDDFAFYNVQSLMGEKELNQEMKISFLKWVGTSSIGDGT